MNIQIDVSKVLGQYIDAFPSNGNPRKEKRKYSSHVRQLPANYLEPNTHTLENGRTVRSLRMEGKSWFVLDDILRMWPIDNYADCDFARDSLPEAETRVVEVLEAGGIRRHRFVTLAGALLVAPGAFAGWKTHNNLIQILLKASTDD